MSDFTFLFIDSFFTGLIIHVRFGFHDENMDKIPFFAFTVLVIFFLLSLFVFSTKALGVFDCMASRVPHIFSSMVGHPAMGSYLLHRLVFVLVG